jgi:hypothetical protein
MRPLPHSKALPGNHIMLRLLFIAAVALLPALLVLPSAPLSAAGGDDAPHCQLTLSFDVRHRPGILEAVATITIPPGQRLTLTLPDLQVSSARSATTRAEKATCPTSAMSSSCPRRKGAETLSWCIVSVFKTTPTT